MNFFRLLNLLAAGAAAALISAAELPPGFTETIISTELESPSGMAATPDGRLFVLQQGGEVLVMKGDTILPAPAIRLAVDMVGERGLLGIVFHPQFAQNGFVYLYYTVQAGQSRNRVSRFQVAGDTIMPASETILLEIPLGPSPIHNGGAMQFGPDGKLYVATGDNGVSASAQAFDNLLGKILRLNDDGTIPADNPFTDRTARENRAIWALGLRNPFSFVFQDGSGRMFINDVGQHSFEEINVGVTAANYGWPDVEGFGSDNRYQDPLYAYPHIYMAQCALTGGAFYNPDTIEFPTEYHGTYFFTDYCAGWIQRMDPNNPEPLPFASGISWPVSLLTASNGSLYYLSRGQYDTGATSGVLARINFSGQFAPQFTLHPGSQLVSIGQAVTFRASASGSAPVTWRWQRNGVDIPGATESSYTIPATSLSDNGAQYRAVAGNSYGSATSNAAILNVTSNQPPQASITSPAAGSMYSAGDTISVSGLATDPETGVLGDAALTWRVDFHHDNHFHPFIPATPDVSAMSFTIPRTGEWAANVWYRVHLTATDAAGLTHTEYVDVLPRVVNITLETQPAGLAAALDGWQRPAPFRQAGVVGMERMLSVPALQNLNGIPYEFTGWQSGQTTPALTAITPATDVTYRALFRVQGSDSCRFTLNVLQLRVPARGATGSIRVDPSDQACRWTAISSTPLVHAFAPVSKGSGFVYYTAFPNYSLKPRSAVIQIGERAVQIDQNAATGSADERFVGQLYSSFLGRIASPSEVTFQVREGLRRGVSRSSMILNFLNGQELREGGVLVAGLYLALLNRDADYAGWLYQRNALVAGTVTRLQLVENFLNSPEFRLVYQTPTDEEFVRLLYRNVLLRPPSSQELSSQTAALRGGVTRPQMTMYFLLGPEFQLTQGPRLMAFLVHATLLLRGPAPEELAWRATQIQAGGTAPVVAQFVESPEYRNLLN